MNRTALVTVAALSVVPLAAGLAAADPRKPITKTYTATAPAPDPTNYAQAMHPVCNMVVPQSFHKEKFEAPGAGSLKVEVSQFTGDWDLLIQNSKGQDIGEGGATNTGTPVASQTDSASVKIKKKDTLTIIACNWAGGPSAMVKYTFTFPK